nr:AMP-binding protein [Streptomyces chartreusis]
MTYAELERESGRLATHLRYLGVAAETRVALLVERSVEMVVALLGVSRAGGTFVPSTPRTPPTGSRISSMTRRPRCSCAPRGPGPPCRPTTGPDRRPRRTRRLGPARRAVHRGAGAAEQAAYVIYTSGSTGAPKGVVVPHAGLGNLAAAQIDRFAVGPDARVLQLASLGFDAAVSELLMALLSGAAAIVAPAETLPPQVSLTEALRHWDVTHVTVPPSALATADELPDGLRTLVVAGEACPPRSPTAGPAAAG